MKNKGEEKKEGQGKIRGREGRKKTGKEGNGIGEEEIKLK